MVCEYPQKEMMASSKVVFVSASEKTKSKLSTKVGKFSLYKTEPNGQPIYVNSRRQYLYLDSKYGWSVGEKTYIILFFG